MPWIEEAGVPRWRKLAASALVALAVVLGAAAALLYGFLIWTSPPEVDDGSSRHFRGAMFIYVFLPFFIFAGPVWAAAWIAKRIDPSRRD